MKMFINFSLAEEVCGRGRYCQGRVRRPTVWLRPAGGGGRAAIGLWGGTGGCWGDFPERGRSGKHRHSKMKGEMLKQGECEPRSEVPRNRSCTQFCASRGSRSPGSHSLPASASASAGRGRDVSIPGLQAVENQTHIHTEARPAAWAGLNWHSRLMEILFWVPFLPLTNVLGSSAPSYFLLWLISSLKGRSWSSTAVTQSQILNWLGLSLESNSDLSGHYRSIPEPGLQTDNVPTPSTGKDQCRPPYTLDPECLSCLTLAPALERHYPSMENGA